ncbi:MAG: sulfate ABC transporter permease subunit CysT [Chloroflexota bacterium]
MAAEHRTHALPLTPGPVPIREEGSLRATLWVSFAPVAIRILALGYLALVLVIPLAAVVHDGLRAGPGVFWSNLTRPAAWHAIKLTLWTAAVMAAINAVMGTLTAYVLVRYEFRGKSIVNALVDLPLAIPTLVTGVMLVILYGPQAAIGSWLKAQWGLEIIFAPPGIILALLFVSFPFVVRALQPVLMELDIHQEEMAYTLGASPWLTFCRVLLPAIAPAIASGTLLSFARALGEFGAIIVVAGNFPMRSQTAAVYVLGEIESKNPIGASAVSTFLLAIAFTLMVVVDRLQRRREA